MNFDKKMNRGDVITSFVLTKVYKVGDEYTTPGAVTQFLLYLIIAAITTPGLLFLIFSFSPLIILGLLGVGFTRVFLNAKIEVAKEEDDTSSPLTLKESSDMGIPDSHYGISQKEFENLPKKKIEDTKDEYG